MNGIEMSNGLTFAVGTQQTDVLGTRQGHEARNVRSKARAFHGLSIPASCTRPSWMPRHGVSQSAKGYLRPRLLLASAQLRDGEPSSKVKNRLLAEETGGEQATGCKNTEATESEWMGGPGCLGMPSASWKSRFFEAQTGPLSFIVTGGTAEGQIRHMLAPHQDAETKLYALPPTALEKAFKGEL